MKNNQLINDEKIKEYKKKKINEAFLKSKVGLAYNIFKGENNSIEGIDTQDLIHKYYPTPIPLKY